MAVTKRPAFRETPVSVVASAVLDRRYPSLMGLLRLEPMYVAVDLVPVCHGTRGPACLMAAACMGSALVDLGVCDGTVHPGYVGLMALVSAAIYHAALG